MQKNASSVLRKCASLVLVSALTLVSGCLYMADPGHVEVDPSAVGSMEGARVELIRHSTSCDSAESEGLIVEVGPWVEYSAEAVSALNTNCSLAPHPGVEVHVEEGALVFDFSNVEEPGTFPGAEFEGYILNMLGTDDAPILVAALIDRETTTLDIVQDDLNYDLDRLAVNLAGRDFDSSSFLRVQLYLTQVSDPSEKDAPDAM